MEMARFLGLVTLTQDGAAKILQDGLEARRRYYEHIVGSAGGTVEGIWLTNVGDWDVIMLLDIPGETPAEGAAATLARKAAGVGAAERWIQLVDFDDAASALAAMAVETSS